MDYAKVKANLEKLETRLAKLEHEFDLDGFRDAEEQKILKNLRAEIAALAPQVASKVAGVPTAPEPVNQEEETTDNSAPTSNPKDTNSTRFEEFTEEMGGETSEEQVQEMMNKEGVKMAFSGKEGEVLMAHHHEELTPDALWARVKDDLDLAMLPKINSYAIGIDNVFKHIEHSGENSSESITTNNVFRVFTAFVGGMNEGNAAFVELAKMVIELAEASSAIQQEMTLPQFHTRWSSAWHDQNLHIDIEYYKQYLRRMYPGQDLNALSHADLTSHFGGFARLLPSVEEVNKAYLDSWMKGAKDEPNSTWNNPENDHDSEAGYIRMEILYSGSSSRGLDLSAQSNHWQIKKIYIDDMPFAAGTISALSELYGGPNSILIDLPCRVQAQVTVEQSRASTYDEEVQNQRYAHKYEFEKPQNSRGWFMASATPSSGAVQTELDLRMFNFFTRNIAYQYTIGDLKPE